MDRTVKKITRKSGKHATEAIMSQQLELTKEQQKLNNAWEQHRIQRAQRR
jgi:hypothetical protein